MKVYLAIDLKDGAVVWGCRGERDRYEEIDKHSDVVSTSQPLAFLSELSPKRAYVADLNAIAGDRERNLEPVRAIAEKVETIVDRGYRNRADVERDPVCLKAKPVLGTETYCLGEVFDGVFVSLDFFFGDVSFQNLKEKLEWLNSFDLEGVIVLDISRVGTGKLNLDLVEKVLELSGNPVYVGGGVSGVDDLEILKSLGVSGAIVATAFHRGRISLDVLRRGWF